MIETKFKQTEIGLVPEDWRTTRLGSLGFISKGSGITREEAHSGTLAAIRYGEIYTSHNDYIREFYSEISEEVALSSKRLKCGDLLFAASGETKEEIGKCVAFVSNEEAYAGGDIIILSIDTDLHDARYWGYYLNSTQIVKQKAARGQGDAVVHIVPRELATVVVAIPSRPEQQRIAEALSNIDNLISSLSKMIEKKRLIKQGAMQQLLTGKKHLPGFDGEWEEKTIGEICELRNGYTPSKAIAEYWQNGTIPWFRMEDIRTNGHILRDSITHITPKSIKGSLFPAKSIIISTTATIGEHALLIVDSLANQRFTNLSIRKSFLFQIDIMYFYWYCFILGEWCRNNINEGGLTAVNMSDFVNVLVPLPPTLEEQSAIASILTTMDNEIESLEEERDKYVQLKEGMMQKLLTGQIRLVNAVSKQMSKYI